MNARRTYPSPAAFRRALTDKLKAKAAESRWSLSQLQRQITYDRLLERLYQEHREWIVKGAVALLARDLGVRATIDIDFFRNAARETAERELRAAAARDIGDWFRFEVGGARVVTDAAPTSIRSSSTVLDLAHLYLRRAWRLLRPRPAAGGDCSGRHPAHATAG
jgi:cell wall-associated NlpC family hydrolase